MRADDKPKYKLYIKQSDQMWHVLFWDDYGGRHGWHRNDDMTSASGFLLKRMAIEWAEKRLQDIADAA